MLSRATKWMPIVMILGVVLVWRTLSSRSATARADFPWDEPREENPYAVPPEMWSDFGRGDKDPTRNVVVAEYVREWRSAVEAALQRYPKYCEFDRERQRLFDLAYRTYAERNIHTQRAKILHADQPAIIATAIRDEKAGAESVAKLLDDYVKWCESKRFEDNPRTPTYEYLDELREELRTFPRTTE